MKNTSRVISGFVNFVLATMTRVPEAFLPFPVTSSSSNPHNAVITSFYRVRPIYLLKCDFTLKQFYDFLLHNLLKNSTKREKIVNVNV